MKSKQKVCFSLVTLILLATGCVSESAEEKAKARKDNVAENASAANESVDPGKSVDALLYESRINFAVGNFAKAEKLARQVVQLEPNDTRHHMLLANICLIGGNIDQAVESFDEIIRLRPDLQPQLWQRGLALYYADEFQKGKAQFETHQEVNSADVENAVWHLLCADKLEGLE